MITLITGPMYSGKSTELFKYIEREYYAKKIIRLIRPKKDDRGYFSHFDAVNKALEDFEIDIQYESKIDEALLHSLWMCDSIFIDEFFMIEDAYKIASSFGAIKNIFYAGLSVSSELKVFPEVIKLLPYCDEIIKLNGVCMKCGSYHGNYSFYKGKKSKDIVIGDSDYLVLCQNCYNDKMWEKDQ